MSGRGSIVDLALSDEHEERDDSCACNIFSFIKKYLSILNVW